MCVNSSSDSGPLGNVVILAGGVVLDHPDDFYRMQPSPSSSSLSSAHSAPSQMVHSAPSTLRVGSPSLPDRFRHNREVMMLLPPHRDRPSSVMIPAPSDHTQPFNLQRALFHQVIGPCKPCSDPNLSVAEKVLTTPSSWSLDSGTREALPFLSGHLGPPVPPRNLPPGPHLSMHFDAFSQQLSELPPALPARSLRKSPLHPIPASPTGPQSLLDGSSSTLSGSASSGVSSLGDGISGAPPSSCDPEESHYRPGPGALVLGPAPLPQPQASVLAPDHHLHRPHHPPHPPHPPQPNYSLHLPPLYQPQQAPVLPPKPPLREEEEEEKQEEEQEVPRPMPRLISQPLMSGAKEEPAKAAWQAVSEE
ncbi:hypothetical protein CRUP_038095 [Coryphaenoides rupestris]|nr:hypothetical protein CRUP_038095 [Coryphaenoides rupestris]